MSRVSNGDHGLFYFWRFGEEALYFVAEKSGEMWSDMKIGFVFS